MSAAPVDTGTLSWVRDEIDLVLAQAGEALSRHAAAPDEKQALAAARAHLHQASGALALVGLAGVTHCAESLEARLAALAESAATDTVVAVCAAAGALIAALRRYLDELMTGYPDQPLRLHPHCRALALAAGLAEPTPLALFHPDLTRRPPRREPAGAVLAPERLKALGLGFARGLAKWRAGEARGLAEIRNAVIHLEQGLTRPEDQTLWWIALAWLDASDRHDGALLEGLERQLAALADGRPAAPPEDLLKGLLYDIAISPPGDSLRENVRACYRLAELIPAAESSAQTRREVCRAPLATAMAEWERFGQGAAIALMRFHDVALLLAASARDSNDPELARLAGAIADFAAWLRQQPERTDTALVFEVAGALLLVEDAVEQEGVRGPAESPLFAAEVDAQIGRLGSLRDARAELAPVRRRWREQRLIARVAEEILIDLEAAEPVLDGFFATPQDGLPPDAIARLHRVAGAFALLDEDAAARAMAAIEARLAAPTGEPFDALAEGLATLGQFAASLARGRPERELLDRCAPPPGQALVIAPPAMPPPVVRPRVRQSAPRPAAGGVDPQLAALFLEEADEQLPLLEAELAAWRAASAETDVGRRLARLLHTFKGGARMCGALELGELAHAMETRVEQALAAGQASPAILDGLDASLDHANRQVADLHQLAAAAESPAPSEVAETRPAAEPAPAAMLRVRADLVDHLVSEAGEMAIARSRIEAGLKDAKGALLDLADNVARLHGQLREFEIHAETGMQSRLGGDARARDFDPLELDRFTRLQELTRMMAESVNDVATVQHALLRQIDAAGEALAVQSRQHRELSHALLSARMVPFATVDERLRRVVRQTARELGREAELDLRGGDTPIDRNVLERMLAPLEHLLRNAVVHGIEPPEARAAAGKPACGQIGLAIVAGDSEITLTLADDGAGLDLEAIRRRATGHGLLAADAVADAAALAEFIFHPGFTTAATVSEVAGRGVGLDVVKNEVAQLGGRVGVATGPQGTRFDLVLPLAMAVVPVLLATAGGRLWAIPAALVEEARELDAAELAARRAAGSVTRNGHRHAWHSLTRLFGLATAEEEAAGWQLLLNSGGERIALEVAALTRNQEVVVKPVGDMLARVPGLTGATVLPDGTVALIVNPVSLARRGGPVVRPAAVPPAPTFPRPVVMVVDDSLTVRKITGRLLERGGYQVMAAKDGVDALEQLEAVHARLPDVILADIEMPRMDGFELVRALGGDARLAGLPVIMITSRIAAKHRQLAQELGVRHYLGKPYDEDALLDLIAGLVKPA